MMVRTAQQNVAGCPAPSLGGGASGVATRWYLARCREGRELATCAEVAKLAPRDLLLDCLVPRREDGGSTVPLFRGYLIVATSDAPALAEVLSSLSAPVEMVGRVGRGYAPVPREAQELLTTAMGAGHVIRTSYATIDRSGLHVTSGPLKGQERRMGEVGPGRRHVRVTFGGDAEGDRPFAIDMPIDIRIAPEAVREAAGIPAPARKFAGTSLPMGRRTPRGRLRWYLVECPEGAEDEMCEAVRKSVPAHVLADAYVPRTERVKKVHGEWVRPVSPLVPGRFAAATADSAALKVELGRTGLPLGLAGQGAGFQPLDDDAWGLVQSFMDGTRTIRESQGEVVGDRLHVWSGPLAGRESVVRRYIRRQSLAFVDLGSDRAGEHTLLMPLAILARR